MAAADEAGLRAPDKEKLSEDDNSIPVTTSRICPECGSDVDFRARICPFCGIRVKLPPGSTRGGRSRTTAALLALFLGVAGAHKFYLGDIKMGIIYILISLTAVGFVLTIALSIYDFIILMALSDAEFARKYG